VEAPQTHEAPVLFAPPATCPILLWTGTDAARARIAGVLEKLCYRGVYWIATVRRLDDTCFDLGPLSLCAIHEYAGKLFTHELYHFGESSRTYHASMTPEEAALTEAVQGAIAQGEDCLALVDGPITDFIRSRLSVELMMATAAIDELLARTRLTGRL
jgi:hypothetical protein